MATTTNFGWETPDDTDLVKDGALAMRTLGNAIDTSLVDLKGGTTGQVLSKTSNTDMDFTWVTSDDANAIQNAIVDAKGDLIAASAADTPARLAVGNNGESLVADSSTTTGLRWTAVGLANPVINGGMDIWQRGTSFSLAASTSQTYLADRWAAATSTNQATTVSRQLTNDSTNLPFIQYCMRFQRNSGQTGTSNYNLIQNLETTNSIPFAGRTVTLSLYARKGTNYSAASDALNVFLITGTGTDQNQQVGGFSGQVVAINGTAATLTASWQRFSFTATLSATATQIATLLRYTPVGTAGADDYFEVTGVQLDVGSVALPFRRSGNTLAGELQAAQRYYYLHAAPSASRYAIGSAAANTATEAYTSVQFPVTMRTVPTLVATSGTNYYAFQRNGANDFFNSLTIERASTTASFMYNNTEISSTAGHAGVFRNEDAAASVAFNAEL